jgi:type VII secretion-associated protein (TIGR03931 family)
VLLIGGVARAPLLAELLDEAGIVDVVVAPLPDATAVLGALRLPVPPGASRTGGCAVRAPAAAARRLPPPAPRPPRPLRTVLLGAAAAALVASLLAVGALLSPPSASDAVPAGVLVQYGYRLDVPSGWEHTGGLPERRRSLLTPVAAPEGSDVVAVESTPLGYDTGAEPGRARAELRSEFDAAVAGGAALSGYVPAASVAGRAVTSYLQRDDGATVVEWFVLLDGDAQLSVGCRHTPARAAAVRAACEVVVGSVRRG